MRRRGRPRLPLDVGQLRHLRGQGLSLRRIAQEVGVGKDTVRNTLKTMSKNPQDNFQTQGATRSMGEATGAEAREACGGP